MSYAKGILTGGVIFLAGYAVGGCTRPKAEGLEKKVVEKNDERTKQLLTFLKKNPKQKENKQFSLENLWEELPPEMKQQLIKQLATYQLESTYEDLKTKSGSMYEEVKHYLSKHLGRKQ